MAKTKKTTPTGLSAPVREDGTVSSNYNEEFDYIIRYITEAIDYRTTKMEWTARAITAGKGVPSRDGYTRGVDRYADLFANEDADRQKNIKARCKDIRARKNMIVARAIDSMVSQAQGGVGVYECAPYDPHFLKDAELIDKLEYGLLDFYHRNKFDSILPTMLEWAGYSGAAFNYLEICPKTKKLIANVIPDTEMLLDPLRNKRNRDRYQGHQYKASWTDFKKYLVKCKHTDSWALQSINNVDTYLTQVEWWIQKHNGNFESMIASVKGGMENLPHMIDTFYKGSALAWVERNTKYRTHSGMTGDGQHDDKYHTDEVEVSILFDLDNNIKFTVINRKFIVSVERNYLRKKIPYQLPEVDEISGAVIDRDFEKEIYLDHPYVALEYKRSLWEAYPYSPLIHVLDIFDDICALETMIYHTISIMTPITFTGNPKDIEKLGQIAGVSGEAIKGFIANSVTILNKAVDLTPAMTMISRLENTVMDILHGVDPAKQSAMLGDRATAAEAMQAASLVSQGLNSLIGNVETWAAELATKGMYMMIIHEGDDYEYTFTRGTERISLSPMDMSGDVMVKAVLKSKIKAEQHADATNTIQWFVPLMQSDFIPNKQAMAETVVPKLAAGYTRKQIMSWFAKTQEQQAKDQAKLDLAMMKAEAAKKQSQANTNFGYVDPTSGGTYGMADISKALGARGPVQQTSRQLNYQVGAGDPPQGTAPAPMDGPPEVAGLNLDAASLEADLAAAEGIESEESVDLSDDPVLANLAAQQSPVSGGRAANDPLTGANSPLTQGLL